MTEKTAQTEKSDKSAVEFIKDSLMVFITLIFVLLYAAAYAGKFDPLKDNTLLLHIEPVIFILVGYLFARRPARQSEKSFKEEIARLNQKTDAAGYAKEKAQIECEKLEEKIRNARAALKKIAAANGSTQIAAQTESIKTAVSILDS